MAVRVQPIASRRLDEIHRYTAGRWGEPQADRYIEGLFDAFARIADGTLRSLPVPLEFGVDGFYARQASHVIYWRYLSNGDVGIVTVLHQRMHQMDRFREDADR